MTNQTTPASQLPDLFEGVMQLQPEWSSTKSPAMDERGQLIRNRIPARLREVLDDLDLSHLVWDVEGRDGTGLRTRVPWVRIFSPEASPKPTEGWYFVYLFTADATAVYLSLNQGATTFEHGGYHPRSKEELANRVSWARELLHSSDTDGFTESIELADPGPLGKAYERGHVLGVRYESGGVPSEEQLAEDIRRMAELLQTIYEAEAEPTADAGSLVDVVGSVSGGLLDAGLEFGSGHLGFVRSFVVSLATKGFVLLTGLSGSGKSRLAVGFGEWLGEGRYWVEAVRPDWTGPDSLLGFPDGLSVRDGHGRLGWHVPGVLKFMLEAANDGEHPYLLLLDEMNLAHVERYFADVLSGMESGVEVLPNLERGGDGVWRERLGGPPRVKFPSNLLVVGTVNIDETTYMFSPKVLDRANTLEFRVESEDLVASAEPIGLVESGSDELVRVFLESATSVGGDWSGRDEMAGWMRELHGLLATEDREFGHRVFFEALRFGGLLVEAGESDPLVALDLQVMQKVLPRVHGSIRQVGSTLERLGAWCFHGPGVPLPEGFDPVDPPEGEPQLPVSFDKTARMTRRLRANHFVSYAE